VRDDDLPLPTDNRRELPATTDGVLRLTYDQIGKRLGMTADAARQLVRRKGWPRTRPNHIGEPVVVSVPVGELSNEQPSMDRRAVDGEPLPNRRTADSEPSVTDSEPPSDDRRSDLVVTVGALRAAVDLLGLQLEAERRRADAASQAAEQARTEAEEFRLHLGAAHRAAETAQAEAIAAKLAADEVRAQNEAMQVAQRVAEARAERAETQLETVQAEAEEARTVAEQARAEAQAAQDATKAAQEQAEAVRQDEEARKARGRLRRAWDGWRGR
jgi:hypothetical protein